MTIANSWKLRTQGEPVLTPWLFCIIQALREKNEGEVGDLRVLLSMVHEHRHHLLPRFIGITNHMILGVGWDGGGGTSPIH